MKLSAWSPNRIIGITILTLCAASLIVLARSTGITGRTQLSDTPGCTCHNSNPTASVSVNINGPDSVGTNSTTTYDVVITGGPLSAAGVNIAADDGVLSNIGSDLQKIGAELTHTGPKDPVSGSVTFSFNYTAPAQAGNIILAATGNSVNLSGNNSGDAWNHAPNKTITVSAPSAIATDRTGSPGTFTLYQNYPNPFNPQTTIRYQLERAGQVRLELYSALGKRIRTIFDGWQNSGGHELTFNGAGLESGVYFYRLSGNGHTETRRMILLK